MFFWILSIPILVGAICVVFSKNPLFSALFLVLSMVGLGALYFQLGAHFISAVQIAVYAGAVMVLFVMVLMLFDRKAVESEEAAVIKNSQFKWLLVSVFLGLMLGLIFSQSFIAGPDTILPEATSVVSTKELGNLLYFKNILSFEILGLLLLVIAVGVVSLSRIEGGSDD